MFYQFIVCSYFNNLGSGADILVSKKESNDGTRKEGNDSEVRRQCDHVVMKRAKDLPQVERIVVPIN